MKKRYTELMMACLLLACFYVLSRQAALVSISSKVSKTSESSELAEQAEQKKQTEQEKQTDQTEQSGQAEPSETATHTGQALVVDAGHGGSDPGMIGVNRLEEKGVNLAVTLKLRDRLEELGYEVCLTRETDQGLYDETGRNKKAQDMARRIERIREEKPVLAVSIHQNSFQDPKVCGPQVFYYETSQEGAELANCIQTSLNETLQINRPRTEKGNQSYYLLKHSPVVLAIVECGFLTNPEEAELLQTDSYQKAVADAIADGIQNYLSGRPETEN